MTTPLADWLALREPADRTARSKLLTQAIADSLPRERPLRVLDLGTGTGSNVRYLAPCLPTPQRWLVVDRDATLLGKVRAPIASCGCFGKADTPPTRLHVAVNLGAVAAAVAVAVQPSAGLGVVLPRQPLAGVPFVLLVACGVGLCFLLLSSLPRTLSVVHQTEGRA